MASGADSALADLRVLVTRPAGRAEALLAALRQRGAHTLHIPMLTIEALEEPVPARQTVMELDRFDALIFISANAVAFGLDLIENYWPQLPIRQRYFAIGAATARALAERDLQAETGNDATDAMNSEALLAHPALANVEGQRIGIFRGLGGRETLAATLRERGARVDYIECYRRAAPQCSAGELQQALGEQAINACIVNSGESLQHLSERLPEGHALYQCPLIVPGERVAVLASKLGYAKPIIARNAGDEASIAALETLIRKD